MEGNWILFWVVSLGLLFFVTDGQDITFTTLEEEPIGSTPIGQISKAPKLVNDVNPSEFHTLTYRVLDNVADEIKSKISVSENTGNVYLAQVLDREELCGKLLQCHFDFEVAVRTLSNSYISILTVRVVILDKNDNSPIFPEKVYSLQITENRPVGQPYKIVTAEDKDVGNNSIQSYEIIPVSDIFGLNVTQNQDNSFIVKVVLKRKLDREKVNRYDFHVVAKDGGKPQKLGTMSISVEVLDENDNPPEFLKSFYNITMKEDLQQNDVVTQVLATDADLGPNGQIFYQFSPHQANLNSITKVFSINRQTGEITLISSDTQKPETVYTFYVDATDKGSEPQSSQVFVNIHVVDAGNNKPEIHPSFLTDSNPAGTMANISESAKSGTPLVHIRVDDSDTGRNGNVSCQMNNSAFVLQSMDGKGYLVLVNTVLDRETLSHYDVLVTCTDQGNPPLSNSFDFDVNLLDENDEKPVFRKQVYTGSVIENSSRGKYVTNVSATDKDIGHNAQIKYYLHQDAIPKFAINSDSGVITANMDFDREDRSFHIIRVLAVDGGDPAQTGTSTVKVNVIDVNDNTPSFNTSIINIYTMENKKENSEIGTVTAWDPDAGNNGKIVYSLKGNKADNFPFIVYPDGVIRTKERLDREHQELYEFEVTALDRGEPPLNDSVKVKVYVGDENDNSPTFSFPNNTNDTVSVELLPSLPFKVTTVSAFDRDFGRNSELAYRITDGNDSGRFSIKQETGDLFLESTKSLKMNDVFQLEIFVSDKGSPPRYAHHKLNVVFLYSNSSEIAQLHSAGGNHNVVIAAIVVVLTVIFSVIIIVIILVIRKKDQRMALARKLNQDSQLGNSPYLEIAKVSDNKVTFDSNEDLYKKKKKEVSFSLDDDFDSALNVSGVYSSDGNSKEFQNCRPDTHIKSLQLHDLLIQQPPKDKSQKQAQKSPHDDISDTSGDTIPSDSGRGGSDMDMSNNIIVIDNTKSYNGHRSSMNSCNQMPYSSGESTEVFTVPHLTPRQQFERKHHISSATKSHVPVNSKLENWHPSYV